MQTINLKGGYAAIVDDEDYERVCGLPWAAYKDGRRKRTTIYARCWRREEGKPGFIWLHRVVMNAPKGMCVDHKDGNGLDNRKSNLRIVPAGTNLHNAMRPISQSGYRGVEFAKHVKKYRAFINHNHKWKHLGYFTCPIEAAKARDREAIRLYGENATLNFPRENE